MRWVPNAIKKWIPDEHAQQFFMAVVGAAHLADDLYDRDQEIDPNIAACELLQICLVEIPTNPFYMAYSHVFMPIMMSSVMQWGSSNQLWRHDDHDVRTHAWAMRFGVEGLIPVIVFLLTGDIRSAIEATSEITAFARTYKNRETVDEWVETMHKAHGDL
jgi:hypothetical protein